MKSIHIPVMNLAHRRCSARIRGFPLLALVLLIAHTAVPAETSLTGPLVRISTGSLRGYFQGQTAIFKGIPYAAPPVGELRWRPPMPATPWQGERSATKAAAECMQIEGGLGHFIQPLAATYGASYVIEKVTTSEDCLYLNVWAPHWPTQSALPVMVWLHGGSNTAGSGSQATYDATSLAAHGVIVVTINYRLGVMGFFSHPELTAESPHHSSGNYGLLDQLAALRWVRDNIAQFGGDPANVTLFGESAGAIDAGVLMTSPLAAHLFRRAILESGPPFGLGPSTSLADAEATGKTLAESAGNNSVASLRSLSAANLLRIANAHGPYAGPLVVDGWVVPQPPARAFASSSTQKVDLMIGLNGREASAFRVLSAAALKPAGSPGGGASGAMKGVAAAVHPLYGEWTDLAIAKYLVQAIYHGGRALDQAASDMLMACPIGAIASLSQDTGVKVYVYKFDRSIPGKGESQLGAFHGLEIPYVFNAMSDRSWSWLPFTDADVKLSAEIETYWTNFAKTGDPNSSTVPQWPEWENGESYLEFSPQAVPVAQRGFAPSFCNVSVERLRSQLAQSR